MRGATGYWRNPILWLSAVLLALNCAIAWPLFHVEYLSQTGSVEAVFIAYARFARDHWPDLGWCPFWFAGLPFQNAYVPALHLTVAAFSYLAHCSAASAFHRVAACLYCLGPVTLFWMACRLTRSAGWSFCAALVYSLLSPSAFLVPAIHADLGSLFWGQRLHAMITYGDDPHVVSLTLLPLAILAIDWALAKRRPIFCVAAALALAAVPLTNWPGAIVLAYAAIAYALSLPSPGRWKSWARMIGMAVLAYAMAVPWMPPSTILTTEAAVASQDAANRFGLHHLLYFAAVAALAWILLRVSGNSPGYLRFFLLFFVFMAAITLSWYWLGITLLAQPNRFHLAMEMGLALSFVFGVRVMVVRHARLRGAVTGLFVIACVFQVVQYVSYARRLIHGIDITRTSEYKTAIWFDRHMHDSRVMVPGSTTFWLNVFTDTPQLEGCCLQSVRTPTVPIAIYGIDTDLTAEHRAFENSLLWLKALGVRAVAVSGPRSTEVYKPFYHPGKFAGRLRELWRDQDDVIYEIPWRYYSLAHAIEPRDLPARAPANGVDSEPLVPYVAAIDRPDAPDLSVRWPDDATVVIRGELKQDQIVSVQENAHPGWHAAVDGVPRRVFADKLGFLAVEPRCSGACTIELHYDGGIEASAAKWISRAALIGSLLWVLLGFRRLTGSHKRA